MYSVNWEGVNRSALSVASVCLPGLLAAKCYLIKLAHISACMLEAKK